MEYVTAIILGAAMFSNLLLSVHIVLPIRVACRYGTFLHSWLKLAWRRDDNNFYFSESYFEVGLVNKLETVIEKQRNQIKKLDRSVLDYQTENDELSCQNEKLSACTRDLRRKLRSTQTQLHSMVDERANLTAKVSHTWHQPKTMGYLGVYLCGFPIFGPYQEVQRLI